MTKRELEKKLKKAGWTIQHGTRHDLATNPNFQGVKLTIPRQTGDLATGTVDNILKGAGLK